MKSRSGTWCRWLGGKHLCVGSQSWWCDGQFCSAVKWHTSSVRVVLRSFGVDCSCGVTSCYLRHPARSQTWQRTERTLPCTSLERESTASGWSEGLKFFGVSEAGSTTLYLASIFSEQKYVMFFVSGCSTLAFAEYRTAYNCVREELLCMPQLQREVVLAFYGRDARCLSRLGCLWWRGQGL